MRSARSLESIPEIHAHHSSIDGDNAPIEPPVENVVFKPPVGHQIGIGYKRANLRREALGQCGPRCDQAAGLAVLDERIEIGEGLAEVKRQFQLEQAEPNLFGGRHVARFHFEVEIVKEYGRLGRKHLQNRTIVPRRAHGKPEHVPVRRDVSYEYNPQRVQCLGDPVSPKCKIGESPVDLRRVREEPERPLECAQRVVGSPSPIVGRAKITPKVSVIRAQALCTLVKRNARI
jgi:hypothetical protein